jgi:hypothetical protein
MMIMARPPEAGFEHGVIVALRGAAAYAASPIRM